MHAHVAGPPRILSAMRICILCQHNFTEQRLKTAPDGFLEFAILSLLLVPQNALLSTHKLARQTLRENTSTNA